MLRIFFEAKDPHDNSLWLDKCPVNLAFLLVKALPGLTDGLGSSATIKYLFSLFETYS